MYQIIYMKADYEPWWKFEGWESNIVSTEEFETEEELQKKLQETLIDFRKKFEHEASKEDKYYAFWTEDEREYCEACEDDIQIFHGIIIDNLIDNKN
ncbi:DUF1033 family protein [Ureibacillus aquaedulcis]|uniref:DUF1033 family protein n=1 Tax=Ureibacillus aquaedulcis TaxID=3058421 RepID=A0ABT8GMM8_9BACL|nr:DUF1033 family protein [Ureibacillus sp. BA0131]MDN4492654.1 DUF1033 family protein [Ureibacillus sp. BA0131]